ncbi:MAG: glycosyltransferase family 2 protein [Paracoccaceae bacterium]
MTKPSVSVVIVSRGRPQLLKLCLLAVSQIHYDPFEIVVVADRVGLDAVRDTGLFDQVKTALLETANISKARNIGISLAAGQVVAFLDDDSVPEPGWLFHLAAVFDNTDVVAAGGYVLGRNGISFQSKAETIDTHAITKPLEVDGTIPVILSGDSVTGIKTVGTNCAFRRDLFQKLGGFDPAFAYFLDESDINIRVAKARLKTAIVPLAQVHHSSAASEVRQKNRMPISLFQVGRSIALFLRKHCQEQDRERAETDAIEVQRRQLHRHMMSGRCEPRDVERILKTLKSGIDSGMKEKPKVLPPVGLSSSKLLGFVRNGQNNTKHENLAGFLMSAHRVRKRAESMVQSGATVSVYLFSRTALFHHVRFHPDGYWEQTGGLYGRSIRSQPLFCWISLPNRAAKEADRVALVRQPWDIDPKTPQLPVVCF